VKNNYFLIHGFLGNDQFFSKLKSQLQKEPNTENVYSLNLFNQDSPEGFSPNHGFINWAKNFNTFVKNKSNENRLGIHTFMGEPSLWSKCYFVSSNPGLIKENEKLARLAWEEGWCYQIDNKPWADFLKLWNEQDIFKHSNDINIQESLMDKNLLKLAFKNWSLTKHEVDLNLINNKKLHWLIGEKDTKYVHIFKALQSKYNLEKVKYIKNCGHRFELQLEHLSV